MEPQIQYAKTRDGVSIAYTVVGRGPPLVVAGDISDAHVQLVWDQSPVAGLYKRLAERNTVIKFDPRGFGLSDRQVRDFSLDARLRDVYAVVERFGLESYALFGYATGGPLAIALAAEDAVRVSRLVIAGSSARPSELISRHRATRLRSVMQEDWDLYLENLAAVNYGFGKEESARTAKFLASAFDADTLTGFTGALAQDDVTVHLTRVVCPTLVVHYDGVHYLTQDMARELVAGIAQARLMVLSYKAMGRDEDLPRAILRFLDEDGSTLSSVPSGTAVILFADIADSTALTERLGDEAFRERARELDGALREAIREHDGTPVEGKLLGDGVLATFSSARQAVEAARACHAAADGVELQLHVGVHAGDVIREADNVYGGAVNVAARIADASAPGEVLVSQTVRDLARTSAGVAFEDRGERELKGVSEPVRVFAVHTKEQATGNKEQE